MPSAAAGPVVEIVMPMVISLVCACAGAPGSAMAAASAAAARVGLVVQSSLQLSFLGLNRFCGPIQPLL
jgi:hypothetical protein